MNNNKLLLWDTLEEIEDGAIWVDIKTKKIAHANKAICHRLGYTLEELLQKDMADINLTVREENKHSREVSNLNNPFWGKFYKGQFEKSVIQESVQITADGKKIPVLAVIHLIELNGREYFFGISIETHKHRLREQELAERVAKMVEEQREINLENDYLKQQLGEYASSTIVGKSGNFLTSMKLVEQVAPTNSSVLITGETGTGKELIARAIHKGSQRRGKSLIKINCAALPENLIESELFGHEKGAFTGAIQRKIGRFELADKGTIFLDEIGELPLCLQAKLLRVLQEGEVERLGSNKTIKTDFRLITATNRDLEQAVIKGEFRADLFYRLNIVSIHCPPLRERQQDIIDLAKCFIHQYSHQMGKNFDKVVDGSLSPLLNHHWSGNIRELKNVIERSVIFSSGGSFALDLSFMQSNVIGVIQQSAPTTLEEMERQFIVNTLIACNWKISGPNSAAERLGLHRSTLQGKMRKLGITLC